MRFLLFSLIIYALPLCAHVIQTDSFELLEKTIEDLNQHDLVIFDYNKTLVIADDALLQSCGKKCLQTRMRTFAPHLTQKQIDDYISIILIQRKAKIIDPQSVKLIQQMQEKGVKVLLLSAVRTGSYGFIPSMEEWRLGEFQQLGYRFQNAFPKIQRMDFHEFRRHQCPPVYLQGLLCSGSIPKGEALKSFFKRTGFRPRRVIFIDNAADHHSSVEKLTRKQRIPYLGYYYTKGLYERKPVDEQIANFQILYLLNNSQWLDDQEAERRKKWNNIAT